tara:strand:- start:106 stop:456 length:351 start_codon:yes stop_codon:yes gene_type:complete
MNKLNKVDINIKWLYKLNLFLVFLIGLTLPFQTLANTQNSNVPFGKIRVRVLKRRQIHIETAALLCALQENGAQKNQIQEAWRDQIETPISSDDKFLVISIMHGMCPNIQPQKPSL